MAGPWRRDQQIQGEEPQSGASKSHVGTRYGEPVAYSIYILLVCLAVHERSTCIIDNMILQVTGVDP